MTRSHTCVLSAVDTPCQQVIAANQFCGSETGVTKAVQSARDHEVGTCWRQERVQVPTEPLAGWQCQPGAHPPQTSPGSSWGEKPEQQGHCCRENPETPLLAPMADPEAPRGTAPARSPGTEDPSPASSNPVPKASSALRQTLPVGGRAGLRHDPNFAKRGGNKEMPARCLGGERQCLPSCPCILW